MTKQTSRTPGLASRPASSRTRGFAWCGRFIEHHQARAGEMAFNRCFSSSIAVPDAVARSLLATTTLFHRAPMPHPLHIVPSRPPRTRVRSCRPSPVSFSSPPLLTSMRHAGRSVGLMFAKFAHVQTRDETPPSFLFTLMAFCWPHAQTDIKDQVTAAIGAGDVNALGEKLEPSVDLTVLATSDYYSKGPGDGHSP